MKTTMFRNGVLGASASLLLLGSPMVQAEEDLGWYMGLAISALDVDFEDANDLSFSDSDTAIQLKGGYMFSDMFGIEAGYVDLGDYDGDGGFRLDADGYWLAGIANWSVADNWDVYGKVGAFAIDATSDQVIPGFGMVKKNDTETNLFGGVGVEYDFGEWNLFGEYAVMDTDIADMNITMISAGLKYEFQ
jgi:hypothetical protein